jgi:hypothetical protein
MNNAAMMFADACKLAVLFSVWLAVWHVLP